MFKAFAVGKSAKQGDSININVSDLSDLSMDFYDIVGFADQLVSWVDEDSEMKKFRSQLDRALKSEVKDETARKGLVESVFGPEVSPTEEVKQETIKKYSTIYEDKIRRVEKEGLAAGEPIDKVYAFAGLYEEILERTEPGQAREWHKTSIMGAAKKALSASEYEEFLDIMNIVAEDYLGALHQREAQAHEEALWKARQETPEELLPSHESFPVPWQLLPAPRSKRQRKEIPWWAVGVPREEE